MAVQNHNSPQCDIELVWNGGVDSQILCLHSLIKNHQPSIEQTSVLKGPM